MDYEKKYNEAIKRAKQHCADYVVETIFPELKESEDEKIRKWIIGVLSTYEHDRDLRNAALAWLENQGEQKPTDKVEPKFKVKYAGSEYNVLEVRDIAGVTYYGIEDELNHIDYVKAENCEIVSEQKPADKEPKFKVGDWIIYEENIWKICRINLNTFYELLNINNELSIRHIEGVDKTAHLWTIQDAKDGDVLYECNEKKPFIFKELKTKHIDDITSYCDIFNGIFNAIGDNWTTLDIVPATKEQSELLFQKMREAGYEWDSEKKELKKLEQKSSWSEEDDEHLERILKELENQRQRPLNSPYLDKIESDYNWLKSLKDRYTWKPSDEQMKALDEVIRNPYLSTAEYNGLIALKEQLKAL